MVSYYNHRHLHESFVPAQEILETDFSLLIGLSVATVVFLAVTLTSIKILRRKGTSNSMYTMTNINGKSSEYSTEWCVNSIDLYVLVLVLLKANLQIAAFIQHF